MDTAKAFDSLVNRHALYESAYALSVSRTTAGEFCFNNDAVLYIEVNLA
jgi:hypothetical protein